MGEQEPLPNAEQRRDLAGRQAVYLAVYRTAYPRGSEKTLKRLDAYDIADDARQQIAKVFRRACKEVGAKDELYKILSVNLFVPWLIDVLSKCKDEEEYRRAIAEFDDLMYKVCNRALIHTQAEVIAGQQQELKQQ